MLLFRRHPGLILIAAMFIFGSTIIYKSFSKNSSSISYLSTVSTKTNYSIIDVNDREPSFKLATIDGRKPLVDGDRSQATVVEYLRLVENCQRDPSLIVVDVGAFLGDFGLYAAACGCQVYIFEVQPEMVQLIERSIDANRFSRSRVKVIHRAVSDVPSNSTRSFSLAGGQTSARDGTLTVSTIRLDDVPWPEESKIFLLKIDVEGFELNVLRSAENLFRQKRIDHLIFEYTAWWTDRAAQQDLLPYAKRELNATVFYALDRQKPTVYGPLDPNKFDEFYVSHRKRHLQTDIYASFIDIPPSSTIKAKPYVISSSFA